MVNEPWRISTAIGAEVVIFRFPEKIRSPGVLPSFLLLPRVMAPSTLVVISLPLEEVISIFFPTISTLLDKVVFERTSITSPSRASFIALSIEE